jgi:hypothetical protein
MQKAYLERIPILNPGQDKIKKIEILSKYIFENNENAVVCELEINKLIFSLFSFTREEIKYIESDNLEELSR